MANLELGERSGSVSSSRPSVGGNSGTWGENEAPKAPKSERKSRPKAEAGVGFLGRGRLAPSHQLGGLRSAVSSSSGSGAEPQPKSNFGTF